MAVDAFTRENGCTEVIPGSHRWTDQRPPYPGLEPFGEEDAGRPAAQRLRHRTASFVSEHPVVVGAFIGAVVWGFAARALVSPNPLVGAVLPVFPSAPGGFLSELVSGYRTTALGGTAAASPALAALGGISYVSFVNTTLAQKLIVIVGPALATVLCYRAVVRRTGKPGAAVVAAAAYASSALMLWSVSEGRVSQLFLMAVMPPLVERKTTMAELDLPDPSASVVFPA